MQLMKASYKIHPHDLDSIDAMIRKMEIACRKCYQTEYAAKYDIQEVAEWIFDIAVNRKHASILEHSLITVDFIFDRGISHELVRHRHTAFSQESTRYCNYSNKRFNNEISVIQPFFFDPNEERRPIQLPNIHQNDDGIVDGLSSSTIPQTPLMNSFDVWFLGCLWSEWTYMTLINTFGRKPQEARSVLLNSLKTEIRTSASIREWRHILNLRAAGTTGQHHPQIAEVMIPLLKEFQKKIPVLFDDITV